MVYNIDVKRVRKSPQEVIKMKKEILIYDVNGMGAVSSYTLSVRALKKLLHKEFDIKFCDMRFARISK